VLLIEKLHSVVSFPLFTKAAVCWSSSFRPNVSKGESEEPNIVIGTTETQQSIQLEHSKWTHSSMGSKLCILSQIRIWKKIWQQVAWQTTQGLGRKSSSS
jgi:hypothetical protein